MKKRKEQGKEMGKKNFDVADLPDKTEPSEQVTTKLTDEEQYYDRYPSEESKKNNFWTNLFTKKER